MDWFERLTGFKEGAYEETRRNLQVVDQRLHSKINGRSYVIGSLETPTLGELRSQAAAAAEELAGTFSVQNVSGDVRAFHGDAANANALFQVASQFNLLEMVGPSVTPEDGVTRYQHDPTQGPACAIAAGAATIFRNYFAPVDGEIGQTRDRQIDCLRDLGTALGNDNANLWQMRNGYAMCSAEGLESIDRKLASLTDVERDRLRDRLRIGLHWQVEVTDGDAAGQLVSQAFCSALPAAYTSIPAEHWRSFATLVLEGTYEATLWAAALNARYGSRQVFLTCVGGGSFGNELSWIHAAMRRAFDIVRRVALDVRIVNRGRVDDELVRLVREYGGA
jgi:hypothetical protein